MVFNKTEQQEREYLQQILNIIKDTMDAAEVSVNEHVQTLKEHKEYLWANKDIDPQEIRSMRESILNHFAVGESVISKCRRLGMLRDTPYFGRIDFSDDSHEGFPVPIYIGIHAFYSPNTKTNLIYDWRAPISGMFYDYELGRASYVSPFGEVAGQVALKRQYRIRMGVMEYMIESSLTVHDEVLQKELCAGTSDRMKNIVATIQREQNRIIRNNDASTLIIQGVAGSGKTSIALHRIAYLLYKFKGEISAKDILIISPNRVYADYISNVLPELGEESVPETSMEQILADVLDNKFKFQNFFEQVTELLAKPSSDFIERVRYKASFGFLAQLDAFILHIENNNFRAVNVTLTKHLTIPAKFIEEQFRRFNRYPMRKRFEVMVDYILEVTQVKCRIEITTANRNMLKKEIQGMFAGNNDLLIYKAFFGWIGKPELFKLRKNRSLEYADIAPMAYLRMALEGIKPKTQVKHLLIDEMQDYTPIQYRVIQKLYMCRKTILGDVEQSVNPYGFSSAEMIKKTFVTAEVMRLNKSYRSTYEINSFAKIIRPDSESEIIERHGEQPSIYECNGVDNEIDVIAGLVSDFDKSQFKSLGIICKDDVQSQTLYERLRGRCSGIHYLSHKSTAYVNGIIVTSAHMAKGLEFDEAIVPHISCENYKTEIERGLLYVAVTRAMHRLSLTYTNKITEFIGKG